METASWNGWHLDTKRHALEHKDAPGESLILDDFTPMELLDFLLEVNQREWSNDKIMAGLINAYDDLLMHSAIHQFAGAGI